MPELLCRHSEHGQSVDHCGSVDPAKPQFHDFISDDAIKSPVRIAEPQTESL